MVFLTVLIKVQENKRSLSKRFKNLKQFLSVLRPEDERRITLKFFSKIYQIITKTVRAYTCVRSNDVSPSKE